MPATFTMSVTVCFIIISDIKPPNPHYKLTCTALGDRTLLNMSSSSFCLMWVIELHYSKNCSFSDTEDISVHLAQFGVFDLCIKVWPFYVCKSKIFHNNADILICLPFCHCRQYSSSAIIDRDWLLIIE